MKNTANSKPKSKNSARVRNAALAAACTLLAVSCAKPLSGPGPHPGVPAVVFTYKKAPELSAAERVRLVNKLDAVFAPYARAVKSLCVMDSSGSAVYARSCTAAVVPASAQKVIVAAAALHYLGAGYRFHTQFAAAGDISNGTLPGDLWLIGSGDPILTSNDLRGGVKILAARGLGKIRGGVAVDAAALGGPERNPLWDAADANYGFSAATSGISLDQDTIEFHVHPASPGAPARIELQPATRVVTFTGSVITMPASYGNFVTINPSGSPNAFVVRGQVAAGARESVYYLPVSRIPEYVSDVVESMLEARSIATVRGGRTGVAPPNPVILWDHKSPPLRFTVQKMLHESNNHIAEQLLRTIGRAYAGRGDDAHGLAAESVFLRSENVPLTGLHLVDGSGLAGANRVSAFTLASLLQREELTPGGNQLYYALPRGGIEGTLRHHRFTTAFGRVRAKSGHLDGVSSLAGYVTTHRHGRLIFAYLLNVPVDRYTADAVMARAVDALAEF